MIHRIEHSSCLSHSQRQRVLTILAALPKGCKRNLEELLPNGHFAFTIFGPGELLAGIRNQLIEIVGFETPCVRSYSLQEAYNAFGWRSYTHIRYKHVAELSLNDFYACSWPDDQKDFVIDGMIISSGEVRVRIRLEHDDSTPENRYIYVTLDELARDWEWPDGNPCGVEMLNTKSQRVASGM